MANEGFDRGRGDKRSYGQSRSYDRPRFSSPRFAPVKEGEELDVKIEAIAAKGDGIAKKDGFVIFVPNTRVGDEVKIRINKVLRRVAFAEIIGGKAKSEEVKSEEAAEEPSEEAGEEEAGEEKSPEGKEESEETEEYGNEEDTEDFGDEDN